MSTPKELARAKRYREEHRARVAASWHKWSDANPDKRKAIERAHKKRYEKTHRVEIRARKRLWWALFTGKIIKPKTCSACGEKCNPHGHHADYSKPLCVIWLCHQCHIDLHKVRP